MTPKKENDGCGCGCANIPISLILLLLGTGYWGFTRFDDLNISQFIPDNISNIITFLPDRQPSDTSKTPVESQPISEEDTSPVETDLSLDSSSDTQKPKIEKEDNQGRQKQKDAKGNQDKQAENIPTSPESKSTSPSQPSSSPQPSSPSPESKSTSPSQPSPSPQPSSPSQPSPSPPQTPWEKKEIRGIYISRYQITNNASEQMIRQRVQHYRDQGINTIIHGVWGNGCTMYSSEVMQQTFGYESCPNEFQDQWLNWLIDEAHKQGIQVHAYFEKGIKLDENSPIFNEAISRRWIVPGVDKTYPEIDHYLLDVEIPEVADFFKAILVEFVQKYPQIDAVQWDDYLGYHDDLPGKVDRTNQLTTFVKQMKAEMKQANPQVSFDLCHHNPYWGKRYFAADWQNWTVDRAFIQIYNDENFQDELKYAEQYAGVAISDQQLGRLEELIDNSKIKSILVFPSTGQPENAASRVKEVLEKLN